jgi:hypothetical protein
MRNAILRAIALLAVPAVQAAEVNIGYIYPSSVATGTTTRLVIGGQGVNGIQDFHISDGGVRVVKTQLVPNFRNPSGVQRRHLRNWLDRIAAGDRTEPPLPRNAHLDEWRTNRWWSALGTLDAGQLAIVERNLFTPRNALQASPSLRQMMLVTVVVDPDAKPGVREIIAESNAGLSAPHPLIVTDIPHVHEPLYTPPHRPRNKPPLVDLQNGSAALDGQIMPGETDAFLVKLASDRAYAFTVTARELQPYIGDAVPGFFNPCLSLKDASGAIVAFADDESRFRPDPVLRFTPPRSGVYRLEIRDVLFRGRADFVYTIAAGDFKTVEAPAADGVVSRKGEVASKKIKIRKPGVHVLEVTARRRGSPLDAVLTLRKTPSGPVLAQWDDVTNKVFTGTVPQGECDPIGTYNFTEAGTYVAEITDRTGNGGADYVWWLDVRRPAPGFEVYSTRSTLPLARGRPLKVGFCVVRKDGFAGDVVIEPPKGLAASFTGNVVSSGVDRVTASLTFLGRAHRDTMPCTLFAHAEINGKTVRVPVTPCDEYEQAFAWKHLVPAESFKLRTRGGGWKNRNLNKSPGK